MIYCLMYLPLFEGGSVFVFVLLCITFSPFKFCNHLEEEERACCFALVVLRMSCYCKFSVTLLHGAVGWSAVCDCVFPDHTHLLFLFYRLAWALYAVFFKLIEKSRMGDHLLLTRRFILSV